eukprot:jgi/Botrbrau1/15086/Bobra.0221s0005.1
MCLRADSRQTIAGATQTYDMSACLQVMPNAHNLTGYEPTQLWVLRTSRYVVLGKALVASGHYTSLLQSDRERHPRSFVPRLHVAVYASESIRMDSEMPRNLGSFIRKASW